MKTLNRRLWPAAAGAITCMKGRIAKAIRRSLICLTDVPHNDGADVCIIGRFWMWSFGKCRTTKQRNAQFWVVIACFFRQLFHRGFRSSGNGNNKRVSFRGQGIAETASDGSFSWGSFFIYSFLCPHWRRSYASVVLLTASSTKV